MALEWSTKEMLLIVKSVSSPDSSRRPLSFSLLIVSPRNSILYKPAFVKATLTISPFRKREVDGLYHRLLRSWVVQFGFDMGGPTGVRIGYTELICNDFRVLCV
jgi:hypothetical protein